MKKLILLLLILAYGNVFSQSMDSHYKIYDTKNKKITTIDQIAVDCQDADVLFFGEDHSDSAGHYVETEMLKSLYQHYGDEITLSMEMWETDCQLVLNEYLGGYINEDRLLKDARPWSNYKDYRPSVEFAKEKKLDVIAANSPRRYVNIVSRKGMQALDSLPETSKQFLPPLPYDTAVGLYRSKFMDVMNDGSPGSDNPRIYYSQNLWDAGMSYSIYQYLRKHKSKKVFHMVGRFHCDEKLGTLAQLQNRKGSLHILNISCFSDDSFANPDWEKFSKLGDYVIVTDPGLKRTF